MVVLILESLWALETADASSLAKTDSIPVLYASLACSIKEFGPFRLAICVSNVFFDLMSLSAWEFDQTLQGWRKFEATREYIKAAEVISSYIETNKEKELVIDNNVVINGELFSKNRLLEIYLKKLEEKQVASEIFDNKEQELIKTWLSLRERYDELQEEINDLDLERYKQQIA